MEEDLPPPMWDLEAAWDDEIDRSIGPCEPEAPADRARMEKGEGEVTMRTRRGLVTVEMTHFRRYWFDPDLRGLDARVGTVGRAGVIKKAARMAVGFEVALRCESLREEAEDVMRQVIHCTGLWRDGRVRYPGLNDILISSLQFATIVYGCVTAFEEALLVQPWDEWFTEELVRASLVPLYKVLLDHAFRNRLVPMNSLVKIGGQELTKDSSWALRLDSGLLHTSGERWFDEGIEYVVSRLPEWVLEGLKTKGTVLVRIIPPWAEVVTTQGRAF